MQWNKYTLKTTTQAVDMISVMLMEQGITGIEINDNVPLTEEDKRRMFIDFLPELSPDEGVSYVTFYTEEGDAGEMVLANLQIELSRISEFTDIGDGTIEKSVTKQEDWVNNWKSFFSAFTVDDIVIKPTWEQLKPEYEGKLTVEIDPGMAFGTGMHETTALCIKQLDKHVCSGKKLLDIGCGSGILSVIALKLGAGHATCIDIDENAIEVSRQNFEANNISPDLFSLYTGNILSDDIPIGEFDIVTANILADVLIPLTGVVAKHLKKGGIYITSGIIDTKEDEVKKAIEDEGSFKILEITRQNDWSSITAERI